MAVKKAQNNAPVTTGPKIPMPEGNFRASAPAAGLAPKIQIGKSETLKLDNGLTVIVVPNRKLPKVSFRLFVDYTPVMEETAAGYVEMMGDLLMKGTKYRTKDQINEDIDYMGASLFSNENGVAGACLSKYMDKFLAIMSDVALNPVFPAEELEKAKLRKVNALETEKTEAGAMIEKASAVMRYGKGHPYGEVPSEKSISNIKLEQIQKHYQTYFKPNISYLVVVGDITKEKAEKYAKQYFGKWTVADVPVQALGLPRPPDKTQVDFVHKAGAVQSMINITYPIELQPGTPDIVRVRLLNTILGGYYRSRVNGNLREGHGWTYGARSSMSSDKLIGYFSANASVRSSVTDSAVVEFMSELNRIRTEKVTAKELQLVKNVLTGQFSQSLEEPGTIAEFALTTARFGLPADYFENYLENLQNVTADEVMLMARKYIRPDRAHIVIVGNKDSGITDKLKQFNPDGKINFIDVYGNPVKENQIPLPPDMTAEKVIQDYLTAINAGKLVEIKDLTIVGKLKFRGPEFETRSWQQGGAKIATEMSMNSQVVSKRVYDGAIGSELGMGGATRTLEGRDLEDLKEQALFCKEATYLAGGYKLSLKSIEDVNGSNAYAIEVIRPDGKKTMDFYDMKTSLKVREITSEPTQKGESTEVSTDFADYKPVEGILFPYSTTVSGVMPAPMKGTVTEIKANFGVDPAKFKL